MTSSAVKNRAFEQALVDPSDTVHPWADVRSGQMLHANGSNDQPSRRNWGKCRNGHPCLIT